MENILREDTPYNLYDIAELINSNRDKYILVTESSGSDYDSLGASLIYFKNFELLKQHLLEELNEDAEYYDSIEVQNYEDYEQYDGMVAHKFGYRNTCVYYKVEGITEDQLKSIENEYNQNKGK